MTNQGRTLIFAVTASALAAALIYWLLWSAASSAWKRATEEMREREAEKVAEIQRQCHQAWPLGGDPYELCVENWK